MHHSSCCVILLSLQLLLSDLITWPTGQVRAFTCSGLQRREKGACSRDTAGLQWFACCDGMLLLFFSDTGTSWHTHSCSSKGGKHFQTMQ